METKFLTEKQVNKITMIPLQTLRNNRFERKGMPYIKIGRSIRYELLDVVDFMQSRKINTEEMTGERNKLTRKKDKR